MKHLKLLGVLAACLPMLAPSAAQAHPHVFVEANMEMLRDDDGNFTEIRHVWRFDELFSATILLDYDENADNKLDEAELKQVTTIVKESIAEYDFYTAVRVNGKAVSFFEPEEIKAYYQDDRLIMLLALELEAPVASSEELKISASDTSYYVAFEFDDKNINVEGNNKGCKHSVEHPDFDKLYADDSLSLTESFFNDPQAEFDLGDEFYSWATIKCA